jgi:hypothetical protein
VADAAADAAAVIRSTINQLPDSLDGPASAPAISAHLRRYAAQQSQARQNIPHPHQLQRAHDRVQTIALANAQSHGAYAAPLAQAAADLTTLNEQAVHGFTGYHQVTDATTAGVLDEPGSGASDADGRGAGDTATADGRPEVPTGADPPPPEGAGQIAGFSPELTQAALGSAGGLLGACWGRRPSPAVVAAGRHRRAVRADGTTIRRLVVRQRRPLLPTRARQRRARRPRPRRNGFRWPNHPGRRRFQCPVVAGGAVDGRAIDVADIAGRCMTGVGSARGRAGDDADGDADGRDGRSGPRDG